MKITLKTIMITTLLLSACPKEAPQPEKPQATAQGELGRLKQAAAVETVYRELPNPPDKGRITEAEKISALLEHLDLSQTLTEGAPRCIASHTAIFEDQSGKTLGTVGLCGGQAHGDDSPGFFISPGGKRQGLRIKDGAAFAKAARP